MSGLAWSERPAMHFPERADPTAEAYAEVARSYLVAAELMWQSEKRAPMTLVAPLSQCMAMGIELFLKSRLLLRGYRQRELREFGHDIHQMWMLPCFLEMRSHAQAIAERCDDVKTSAIPDPRVYTIDWTIKYLSGLYGRDTGYALRYPSGRTQVPYAQPLLWVMYELVDDPKWDPVEGA